jgi:hypothetical protein
MNQEEIVELTKPKRAPRKQKNVSIEPSTQQVEVAPPVAPPIVEQKVVEPADFLADFIGTMNLAKTPRTRKPPKAKETTNATPVVPQQPIVEPTPTPQPTPQQPSMDAAVQKTAWPPRLGNAETALDMAEFHRMYQQFLQSQQPPTQLPQSTQPTVEENVSTNDKKSKKTPKKITIKTEEEDIKYKIDIIKNKITDKKIKKTKSENEYLRDQLAQLEEELETLQVDVPKTKRVNSKSVKIPSDKAENIIGSASQVPTKLPLHQVLRGFGF